MRCSFSDRSRRSAAFSLRSSLVATDQSHHGAFQALEIVVVLAAVGNEETPVLARSYRERGKPVKLFSQIRGARVERRLVRGGRAPRDPPGWPRPREFRHRGPSGPAWRAFGPRTRGPPIARRTSATANAPSGRCRFCGRPRARRRWPGPPATHPRDVAGGEDALLAGHRGRPRPRCRGRRASSPRLSTSPSWTTCTKPIASSTRSAGMLNSVPGTSVHLPALGPLAQSTSQPCSCAHPAVAAGRASWSERSSGARSPLRARWRSA